MRIIQVYFNVKKRQTKPYLIGISLPLRNQVCYSANLCKCMLFSTFLYKNLKCMNSFMHCPYFLWIL